MRGECNGKVGLFPGSFVQKIDANVANSGDTQGVEAVAIHPYKATGQGQLSFETGESIIILGKLQSGWWSGKLVSRFCQGKDGIHW